MLFIFGADDVLCAYALCSSRLMGSVLLEKNICALAKNSSPDCTKAGGNNFFACFDYICFLLKKIFQFFYCAFHTNSCFKFIFISF